MVTELPGSEKQVESNIRIDDRLFFRIRDSGTEPVMIVIQILTAELQIVLYL